MEKVHNELKKMLAKNPNYSAPELLKKSNATWHELLEKKEILKKGNKKLLDNIARFPMPEIVTCNANCRGCYAKKRTFEKVKKCRLDRLILIMYVLDNETIKKKFLEKIKNELKIHALICKIKKLKPIMRWHDSGDIYNLDYFNLILEIAKNNKKIKFYTYTKNMQVWKKYQELKKENKIPDNFNIVSSFIYNHVNYFDLDTNLKNIFKIELQELKKILDNARQENKKIFFCNYNFENLKNKIYFQKKDAKNKIIFQLTNYEILVKLLDNYQDIISYYKDNLHACGICHACCKYENVIFLKH